MPTETIDLTSVDGYSLRHLGHHLCLAGRAAELHRLLAIEHEAVGGQTVNFWFAAHEQAADIRSYVGDLALARADAASSTDHALSSHLPPASLGLEVRYLLIAGAIAGRAGNVTADLLGMALSTGLWSPDRALDHARSIAPPGYRLQAFAALRPQLAPSQQERLNAEALEAAVGVRDDLRGEALASLAPYLSTDLLDRALRSAEAIRDDGARAQALAGLAPYVAVEKRHAVLVKAMAATAAITRLARVNRESRVVGRVESAGTQRAAALTELAPYLSADLLDQALSLAEAISEKAPHVDALAGLVPYLAVEKQHAVLAEAMAVSDSITGLGRSLEGADTQRAMALSELAPYLPADLLEQALDSALILSDKGARVRALTGLAPHLPDALLSRVLAAVPEFDRWEPHGAEVLAALVPQLSANLRDEALAMAATIEDDYARGKALRALAPFVSQAILAEAAAAIAVAGKTSRGHALLAVVPYLSEDLLAEAVTAAATIENDIIRLETLARIAPYAHSALKSAVLSQALAAVRACCAERSWNYQFPAVLEVLAPQLPADLLAQALDAIIAIPSANLRAESVAALAPHLSADLLDRAVSGATTIADNKIRAQTLASLVPLVPDEQRQGLIAQAVTAATATADAAYRAWALRNLAQYVHVDRQHDVLARALYAVEVISTEASRASALTELAPWLPGDLMPRALHVAAGISSRNLVSALAGLVPYLPANLLPEALAQTTRLEQPWYRLEALAGFVPHLSADDRPAVLAEMSLLDAAIPPDINDSFHANAAAALAAFMSPEALAKAASMTEGLREAKPRAKALTALALHATGDQRNALLAKAVSAVAEIADGGAHGAALAELMPHLPLDLQPRAISGISTIKFPRARAEALIAVAEVLPAELLSQVVTAVIAVPDEAWSAMVLAGLASRLPAESIDRALVAAAAMSDQNAKATALAGLIPFLAESQRPSALNQALAAGQAAGPSARAAAFTAVAPYLRADMRHALLDKALTAVSMGQDNARAPILAQMALLLEAEQLDRAIAIAAAETDESQSVMLLQGLIPHADAAQLANAIEARPGSRGHLLKTAVLAKAGDGLMDDERSNCVNLIRAGINGADRLEVLTVIGSLAPVIAEIAGTTAIDDCVRAIDDVSRWWT